MQSCVDSSLLSRAIEALTSPLQGEQSDTEATPDLAFFRTLQSSSANFISFINTNKPLKESVYQSPIQSTPPESLSCIGPVALQLVYYEYTSHLLTLSALLAAAGSDEFINLSLQTRVTTLFQFIFSLCVVPFLLPGNGPPVSERSPTLQHLIKHKSKLTVATLSFHLVRCYDVILLQSHTPHLSPHLRDVAASLLQLSRYSCPSQSQLGERCRWYRDSCSQLLGRFQTPLVVREILVLQGLARRAGARWVVDATSQELSRILVAPLGIQSVLRGFLDAVTQHSSPEARDYTSLRAIARVIAANPMGEQGAEYYTAVCDQLIDILHLDSESLRRDVIPACLSVVESLVESQPCVAESLLLSRITGPLDLLAADGTAGINEAELTQTIRDIHYVITGIPEWHSVIENWICGYMPLLCHMLCSDTGRISPVASSLSQVVDRFFLSSESEHCVSFLLDSLAYPHSRGSRGLHPDLAVSLGDGGSLRVTRGPIESDVTPLVSQLFRLLARREKCGAYSAVVAGLLRALADSVEGREGSGCYREGALCLGAQLLEERGEYVLSQLDTESVLQWASRLVVMHCRTMDKYCDLSEYNFQVFGGTSSLSMAFGSLTYLLSSSEEVTTEMSSLLQSLLPHLEGMGERFPDELLRAQSADLRICIATCGAVWSDLLTGPSSENSRLREEVTENHTGQNSSFSEALSLSLDPMLPIRANGIKQLSRLIYRRDEEALSNADRLMQLFKENLSSEDSYLYLSAISGLASLASVRPREVLSDVSAQFAAYTQQTSSQLIGEMASGSTSIKPLSRINSVEFRMKLGEVLLRAARETGQLFPQYGEVVSRALLTGVRDREPLVRASALSNLAECCLLLGYSLSKCVQEVVSCVERLVPVERDATVRRAAVLVLCRMMDKPQEQILHIFGGTLLRRTYQLLKLVHSSDPDLTTRTQAQSGIERLNGVMKQFLTPVCSRELKKTLYVMDIPPDPFDMRQ